MPANVEQYKKKQGNPDTQIGINGVYRLFERFGFTVGGGYCRYLLGRLCLVRLPQSRAFDAGVFWEQVIGASSLMFSIQ